MENWLSQRYRMDATQQGFDPEVVEHAVATAEIIRSINPNVPLLFSLKHLALRAGVPYEFLRAVVERQERHFYRTFRIRKRPLEGRIRFRLIAAPVPPLMSVQRWIATRILSEGHTHEASVAYARHSSPLKAASFHCNARWLIKIDVMNFFESITEVAAYRAFRRFGYQPLLSFEMGRLCTRVKSWRRREPPYWRSESWRWSKIDSYKFSTKGALPQGAPTSPMLANLTALELDDLVTQLANKHGLVYTRYADDLCFSTTGEFSRGQCSQLVREVYKALRRFGLSPQTMKTVVAPPGARKIVLGLIVDGEKPRLPREFKARLRQHLHFLTHPSVGPALHAAHRGFASIIGLRHHIAGLIEYAASVDPAYGALCRSQFTRVQWPF